MNAALWSIINELGWFYWMPFIFLAGRNLYLLSRLAAPATSLGRAARTFAWLAHLPLLFAPWFNVMGSLALPLMLVANNLLYRQLREACEAAIRSPNGRHRARRILSSLVANKP